MPSGKGRKRQKKGEKGRIWLISRMKGGQTPLKPPFATPPFAADQVKRVIFKDFPPKARDLTLQSREVWVFGAAVSLKALKQSSESLNEFSLENTKSFFLDRRAGSTAVRRHPVLT